MGDTVVSDETVLGPEAGFEDSDIHRVGRVSSSVESLLGIDDDRMETDISQLLQSQAPVVLGRNNLSSQAQPDDVRLTVCERLITKINHDLDVVGGHRRFAVPPNCRSGKTSLPGAPAQLLLQHNLPLTEGATYSRANRGGDRSAQGILMQLVILGDMLSSAKPYFLPVSQLSTAVGDENLRPWLQHSRSLFGMTQPFTSAMAWTFLLGCSQRTPRAIFIQLFTPSGLPPGGVLETSWCSLRQGQASEVAGQIIRLLRGEAWDSARPLRLSKPWGSKSWMKDLVRSSARAKEGGLHGLQFLPE